LPANASYRGPILTMTRGQMSKAKSLPLAYLLGFHLRKDL
jgi:hypothetical protein